MTLFFFVRILVMLPLAERFLRFERCPFESARALVEGPAFCD